VVLLNDRIKSENCQLLINPRYISANKRAPSIFKISGLGAIRGRIEMPKKVVIKGFRELSGRTVL